jgi:long-subunit fatty acid transport protein
MRPGLALLSLSLLIPSIACGYGTRVATQDAEATARGNAFTATADDPAAIYYNPAGLMQLDDFDAEVGFYGISIDQSYKPLHGQEDAHPSDAHEPAQSAPQFFLTYHPKQQPFAFGLGVYMPFGSKVEWPDDASFRQAGLDGSLIFLAINPTMAVQITRTLSVGIGISANYENADLRQGLTAEQGDYFDVKGSGWSIGGDIGILWKPTPRQAVGLTYHSPVSAGLTGHTSETLNNSERSAAEAGNAEIAAGKAKLEAGIAEINSLPIPEAEKQALIAKANATYQDQLDAAGVPASGSFPTSFPTLGARTRLNLPQYAVLGYSFRPTPDWNIETDIDWTNWNEFEDLTVKQSDGTQITIPFHWKNSFLYEIGATHWIGPYSLSAGYIYSETSVPSASFNPIIPDSARHLLSVGVGRTFGSCRVDLSYELGIAQDRTIVNDAVSDGRYSFLSNAVSLSVGYHF